MALPGLPPKTPGGGTLPSSDHATSRPSMSRSGIEKIAREALPSVATINRDLSWVDDFFRDPELHVCRFCDEAASEPALRPFFRIAVQLLPATECLHFDADKLGHMESDLEKLEHPIRVNNLALIDSDGFTQACNRLNEYRERLQGVMLTIPQNTTNLGPLDEIAKTLARTDIAQIEIDSLDAKAAAILLANLSRNIPQKLENLFLGGHLDGGIAVALWTLLMNNRAMNMKFVCSSYQGCLEVVQAIQIALSTPDDTQLSSPLASSHLTGKFVIDVDAKLKKELPECERLAARTYKSTLELMRDRSHLIVDIDDRTPSPPDMREDEVTPAVPADLVNSQASTHTRAGAQGLPIPSLPISMPRIHLGPGGIFQIGGQAGTNNDPHSSRQTSVNRGFFPLRRPGERGWVAEVLMFIGDSSVNVPVAANIAAVADKFREKGNQPTRDELFDLCAAIDQAYPSIDITPLKSLAESNKRKRDDSGDAHRSSSSSE